VIHKPLGAIGGAILVALVLIAVFAPSIAAYPPKALVGASLVAPGGGYLLGTDEVGRDVLSRVVWGARLSLYVGILAVAAGTLAGLGWGIATGFLGGSLDLFSQRIIDTLMAFPSLILALALVAAFGSSINNVVLAIAISIVPQSTRTIRSAVLGVKNSMFVDSARVVGASNMRIMVRHILPQTIPTYIVLASLYLGNAIIAEASLSFLGVGVPPDEPSWGGMMSGSTRVLSFAPWVAIAPGSAISLVVYGFNLLGDALRDVLDPRLRGR
jgi:peptide/nickel transport system permease protein